MHFVNTERINKVVIYFNSSSICVSPGFGGLTGGSPAVRPVASRRSDRRRQESAADHLGGSTGVRSLSDRRSLGGQTSAFTSVRPRSIEFEGNFFSAKSFQFLGIPTIHPPGWLSSCDLILHMVLN